MYPALRNTSDEITPASPSSSGRQAPRIQDNAHEVSVAPAAVAYPTSGLEEQRLTVTVALPLQPVENDIDDDPFAGYVLPNRWLDDSPRLPVEDGDDNEFGGAPQYELGNSSFDDSYEMSRVPWLGNGAEAAASVQVIAHTTTVLPPAVPAAPVVPSTAQFPPLDIDSDSDDDPFAHPRPNYSHGYRVPVLQPPLMPLPRSNSPQIPLRPHLSEVAPTTAVLAIAPPPFHVMPLAEVTFGTAQVQASSAEPLAALPSPPGPAGMGASTGITRKGSSLGPSRQSSSASSDSDPFSGYVPELSPLEDEESVVALLGRDRWEFTPLELQLTNASIYESEQGFARAVQPLVMDPTSEGELRGAPELPQPEDDSAGGRRDGTAASLEETRAGCAGAVNVEEAAAAATTTTGELVAAVDVMAVGAAAVMETGPNGPVQVDAIDEVNSLEVNSPVVHPSTESAVDSGPDSAAGPCAPSGESAGAAAVLDLGPESLPVGADRAHLGNPGLVEAVGGGGGEEDNANPTAPSEPEKEPDTSEAGILRNGDDNVAQSLNKELMAALGTGGENGPGTEVAIDVDHNGGILGLVEADGVKCAAETAPARCIAYSSPDEDMAFVHAAVLAVIAAIEVLATDEPQEERADATKAVQVQASELAKTDINLARNSIIAEQVLVPGQAVPVEQVGAEQQCAEPPNKAEIMKQRATSAQGASETQGGRVAIAAAVAVGEVAEGPLAAGEPAAPALEDAEAPSGKLAAIEMAYPSDSVASDVGASDAGSAAALTAVAASAPASATAASSTGAATGNPSATEPPLKPPLPPRIPLARTTVAAVGSLGASVGVAPSGVEVGNTSAANAPPMYSTSQGRTAPSNTDAPGSLAATARIPGAERAVAAIVAPCSPSTAAGISTTYGRSSVTGRRHSSLGCKAPRQAGPSPQTGQRRDSSTCGSHCDSSGSADALRQPDPQSNALVGSALTAAKALRRSAIDLPMEGDKEAEAECATGLATRRVTGTGTETGPGTVSQTGADGGQVRSLGPKAAMTESENSPSQAAPRSRTIASLGSGSAEMADPSSASGSRRNRTSSSSSVCTRPSMMLFAPMPSDTPAATCSLIPPAGRASLPRSRKTSLADSCRQAPVATQRPQTSIGPCRLPVGSELNAMPASAAAPPVIESSERPKEHSRPKTDMAPAVATAGSQQATTEMVEGRGLRALSDRATVARHLRPVPQLIAPQANFRLRQHNDSTMSRPLGGSTGAPSIQSSQAAAADSLTAPQARQGRGFTGADDEGQAAWLASPDSWLHHLSAKPNPPGASGFSDSGVKLCAPGGAQATGENDIQCTQPCIATESSGFEVPQSQGSLSSNANSSSNRHQLNCLPLRQATRQLPGMPLLSELLSRYPVRQAHACGPEIALVSGQLFVSDRIRKVIETTGGVAARPSKSMAAKSAAAPGLSSGPPSPISRFRPKGDWVMPGGPSVGAGACVGSGRNTYTEKRRAEKAQRAWMAGIYGGPAEIGTGAGGGGAGDSNAWRVQQGWVWDAAPSVGAVGGSRAAQGGPQCAPVMTVGATAAARRLSATGGIAGGASTSAGGAGHGRAYGSDRRSNVERWLQSACTDAPHDGARPSQGLCAPRPGAAHIPGLRCLSGYAQPPSVLQRWTEGYVGTLDLTADAAEQSKAAFRQAPQLRDTIVVSVALAGRSPKRSEPRRRTSS
ncbi:hypothetical protein Vafri_3438 [Volvox africanus]|uniref:Uncharacterized protein n=1 Tax=Volvox africanus TaxID=51714 RepID=A0A8J4ARZ1_9CHLO|nr:hypothetical protein Vafri_3438 [Volvox africanus]